MNKKYVLIMSLVCINVFSMERGGAMSSKGPKKGSPAARATGEKKAEFFKAPEFDDEYVIDSVLQSAPAEIKQWSAAIKHNHETGPILLCGASGVGKTVLAKAVSHDTERRCAISVCQRYVDLIGKTGLILIGCDRLTNSM